jgi:hypothetical protein
VYVPQDQRHGEVGSPMTEQPRCETGDQAHVASLAGERRLMKNMKKGNQASFFSSERSNGPKC